jgi:hypothetical protein
MENIGRGKENVTETEIVIGSVKSNFVDIFMFSSYYCLSVSLFRRRSRSKERDHEKSKRPATTSERRISKSPERKPTVIEDIKPVLKSESELKEEAAVAAMMAKVSKRKHHLLLKGKMKYVGFFTGRRTKNLRLGNAKTTRTN